MPFVLQLAQSDGQLLTQKVLGMHGAVTEHVVHAEHLRLVVHDHAGVRSDGNLACREGVKSVYGLVRRHIIRQVDDDVHLVCSQVVDLLDLDLSCFLCLEDGLDDHRCGLAVRNFSYCERVLVEFFDLCTDLYLASLLLAAVFRAVCRTSCEEVWENLEILSLEDGDGSIYELVEVVREYL